MTCLIAAIDNPTLGFRSTADQTIAETHRPGFRTRTISVAAFGMSGKNIRQKRLVIASNDAVSKGRFVASPTRKVTFERPSRFALRSAAANMSPATSIPVTVPDVPTICAARSAGYPVPEAYFRMRQTAPQEARAVEFAQ